MSSSPTGGELVPVRFSDVGLGVVVAARNLPDEADLEPGVAIGPTVEERAADPHARAREEEAAAREAAAARGAPSAPPAEAAAAVAAVPGADIVVTRGARVPPSLERPPVLRTSIGGATVEWSLDAETGTRLVGETSVGAFAVAVHVDCGWDGDVACGEEDVAWTGTLRPFLIDDLVSSARALAGLAVDPEAGRLGVVGYVSPLYRRVAESGLGVGLSIAYAELGSRERLAIAVLAEYDLTFPFREVLGGRDRRFQLGLGVDAGLAIGSTRSDFDQAIGFGVAIDPYVELRLAPMRNVAIPIRAAVLGVAGPDSSWALAFSTGLMVRWD